MSDPSSDVTVLPDGSAFFVASYPLPKDHWLYAPVGDPPAPYVEDLGLDRRAHEEKIRRAAEYAIRGATMSGKITDFDPDALVQNLLVALLGSCQPPLGCR